MSCTPPLVVRVPALVRHRPWLALVVLVGAACSRSQQERTPSPAAPAAASAAFGSGGEAGPGAGGAAPSPGSYDDCPELASAVEAAFAAKRACTVAADCTLMWPGCPFGCYRPVQRGAVDEVWARILKYNEHCGCHYRCRLLDIEAICKGGVCDLPPLPPRPRAKLLRNPREP